jgi:hypothetical protein
VGCVAVGVAVGCVAVPLFFNAVCSNIMNPFFFKPKISTISCIN